jgi:RNA polymerase sigma-70 factor, ECF subfamily
MAERHLQLVGDSLPLSQRSDDDLMLLARGGQAAAFDELVRRYQPRAVRIAARYLGDRSAAADAAQSTFLELYRAVPRYQPRGQLSSYLYRVLLNQCRMARRAHVTRERAIETLAVEPAAPPDRPDDEILATERAREVERGLAQLSPKLRDVLALRYAGELAYDEIAAALDLPLGTVKRRIFDGLEKLRVVLEGR